MKCPNDQEEMENGVLTNHGSIWMGIGLRSKLLQWGTSEKVLAYKCLKCGKVELYIESKGK